MYRPCTGCKHTECKYCKERNTADEMNDGHIIDFITNLKGKKYVHWCKKCYQKELAKRKNKNRNVQMRN